MRCVILLLLTACYCASENEELRKRLPAGYEFLVPRLTSSFSCDGRGHGYYADVEIDCLVFHMCYPERDDSGQVVRTNIYSFICPNQTIFSQDVLTCKLSYEASPCEQAPTIYEESNAGVGVVPEEEQKEQ